jgi:hypothetical protein
MLAENRKIVRVEIANRWWWRLNDSEGNRKERVRLDGQALSDIRDRCLSSLPWREGGLESRNKFRGANQISGITS